MVAADSERKQRGAWFTPEHLVDAVIGAVVDEAFVASRRGRTLRILDPACGDGRFLTAAIDAVRLAGGEATAVGVGIDTATPPPQAAAPQAPARSDDAPPAGG
ncbi:MAG: N-6 DNA methylase, partial [Acidimicrobiia bacterium]|nr:N-6 DNA methylase [Acidimicrobiia bacterium]